MERWLMALLSAGCVAWGLAAADHPRLLIDRQDLDRIRAQCKEAPYALMAARIKAELESDKPEAGKSIMYDNRPMNYAAMYLLTGEKPYAAEAEKLAVAMVNDQEFWNKPGSKGLTRCAGALRVALAFDACGDAWSDENRKLVSGKLRFAAENIMKSMGQSANTALANNWQAVRYGGAGLAFLASDEPGGLEQAKAAYGKLKAHLNANLGDNGWNPEGIGYTQYPWQFTGPFGIAAERAGLGDLRQEVKKAARTFWTTYAGTIAIPRPGGGFGLRADLSDDHPCWSGDGSAGMAFRYAPKEQLAGFRWMYDYLCGANGDKSYDSRAGGGLYSILYYPASVPPQNPAEVAGLGLNFTDQSHGIAIFRNRFKDENDIVALVNGHARQPSGCHGGSDTNTLRLLGLGAGFIVGSGRTGDANGQTNLFPGAPASKPPGGLGKLTAANFEKDGGGAAVAIGSCMGTADHKRVLGVDFSGAAGAPAVLVMAESSGNGKVWRLNTPEFNEVTSAGNVFSLKAPAGATLTVTVLEPAQPVFKTGTFERGGGANHVGYPYRDKKWINNKWIEFACERNVLTVMVLQESAKPVPKVEGAGSAAKASLKIGALTANLDGDKVTFGK